MGGGAPAMASPSSSRSTTRRTTTTAAAPSTLTSIVPPTVDGDPSRDAPIWAFPCGRRCGRCRIDTAACSRCRSRCSRPRNIVVPRSRSRSEHRPAHVGLPSSDRSRRHDVDVRRVGAVLLPPFLVRTAILTVVVVVVAIFQLRVFVLEYQGPLDHARTALLVPYYGMRCPPFSIYDAADTAASYDGDGGGRYDSSRDSNRSSTALSLCDGDVDVRQNGGGGGPRENDRIVSNGGGGGIFPPDLRSASSNIHDQGQG
jgi:hypothetical protein